MGFAKRASLSAALTTPSDFPPAADLSTIRIVRRDKGPAPVIALADSRPAADGSAKPAGDSMFYKKGSATASTFRPAYWSYEPDPSQVAGPVASLERQLDARRRSTSPATAPIEAKPEEKPLASLDGAPTIRKLAPSAEPVPSLPDPPTPTRASAERKLDTEAVEALLRPMPDAEAMPEEVRLTPAVVAAAPSTPAAQVMPPLAPSKIREEPAVVPADLSPPDDPPPLALPVAPPPSEVPVAAAPSPPTSASVTVESAAPSDLPTAAPEAERSRPSAPPARKRPSQEGAKPAAPESAELDALGAAIDSVLATRWYGSERSGFTAPRVSRSDIAPVTPSGLIADLATVRTDPELLPAPSRGRRGRIIAALSLVAVFALAFAAALLWRTGHGAMLPQRFLPALFGAASLPETTLAFADIHPVARERAAHS